MVPARYVQLEQLLTADEHAAVVDFVRRRAGELRPSQITSPTDGSRRHDQSFRRSQVMFDVEEIWPSFEQRLSSLTAHLRTELGVPWFPFDRFERQVTVSGDGDFFAAHTDNGTDDAVERMLSFVYYARPRRMRSTAASCGCTTA